MQSLEEQFFNACERGDEKMVADLISAGADMNYVDPEYGDTPISQAALKGHLGVVKLLCIPNLRQESKDLALIFAAQKGNTEIMRFLLENGADANASYFSDYTPPLHQTIMQNKMEAFLCLLNWEKTDLNAIAIGDGTPLLLAVYQGRLPMVEELITNNRVNIAVVTSDGENAKKLAADRGHQNIVDFLNSRSDPRKVLTEEKATPISDSSATVGFFPQLHLSLAAIELEVLPHQSP